MQRPRSQHYTQIPEQQLLASTCLREKALFGAAYLGGGDAKVKLRSTKKSVHLRKLGRTTLTKLVREVPCAYVGGEPTLAPVHLQSSCESVFLRILKKEQLPYYTADGRPEPESRSAR